MGEVNGATSSSSNGWVAARNGKMETRRPRDGKEFVGCLVGGRQDTRADIIKELWARYGIRVIKHFGDEQRKNPGSIYIDSRVEVVIILADDLHDVVLQRVLACCRGGGQLNIGINRKSKANWDAVFAAEGFKNPPPWRDGYLIDNPADPKKLEEERKKELEELDKPRMAWVDPKLAVVGPTTLAAKLAAVEVINQYKPGAPAPAKAKSADPTKRGGVLNPGTTRPSPPGFPAQLRAAREAKGWSQGEWAKKLKCAQAPASSWELGMSTPSYEFWLKIHEFFPHLTKPEGVRGQKAWEKTHKTVAPVAMKPVAVAVKAAANEESFGASIRRLRAEHSMKRSELGKRVGVSAKAVEAWELTDRLPHQRQYLKLREIFPELPELHGLRGEQRMAKEAGEQAAPVSAPKPVIAAGPPLFARQAAPVPQATQEELLTINLRSGGSLTLTASVNLLKLKGEDRAFVFEIIDKLQSYEVGK